MRADYGLYEFTCYAYKDPVLPTEADVAAATARADADTVRVLRPRLPTADELLPYLRRIDASRIYSNFGPLALEFEGRLGGHLALPAGGVVSAATGTAALVGSILACAGRARADRPLALVPSYTFVATGVAAQECGYELQLADVDAETWLLDPCRLAGHPNLDRIGVVIPVATYGRPVPQAEWMQFRELTGIPVIIDGAASFETIVDEPSRFLGPIPVAISLHATKSLGTGEGGCVATNDIGLATLIGQALNFGFHFSRDSCAPSTNGKMSEYHAAVGLADLSGWTNKQAAFRRVADRYRDRMHRAGLGKQLHCAPDICSSYMLFHCRNAGESTRLQESLKRHDIEFRLWYGLGLQHQPYFARSEADALPVTDALAPCLLGLPMALDLPDAAIDRVVQAVVDGVRGCVLHVV
jgi:dTDP-4-amino-4,6-dideoxygalactose transaminase